MNTKHTQAWRVAQPSGRNTGLDILCGSIRIAAVSGANPNHDKHAALIAAAPDLLAALRELVAASDALIGTRGHWNGPVCDAIVSARAAIARAEGSKQ